MQAIRQSGMKGRASLCELFRRRQQLWMMGAALDTCLCLDHMIQRPCRRELRYFEIGVSRRPRCPRIMRGFPLVSARDSPIEASPPTLILVAAGFARWQLRSLSGLLTSSGKSTFPNGAKRHPALSIIGPHSRSGRFRALAKVGLLDAESSNGIASRWRSRRWVGSGSKGELVETRLDLARSRLT